MARDLENPLLAKPVGPDPADDFDYSRAEVEELTCSGVLDEAIQDCAMGAITQTQLQTIIAEKIQAQREESRGADAADLARKEGA